MKNYIDRSISIMSVIFVLFLLFYAYYLFVSRAHYSIYFLLIILPIYFLNFMGKPGNSLFGILRGKSLIIAGFILISICVATFIYLAINFTDLTWRVGANTNIDFLFASIILIPVLLSSWKAGGSMLFTLILISLAYISFGPIFPGILSHSGLSFKELLEVEVLGMADAGLFSTVTQVVGTWVSIFIVYAGLASGFGVFDGILKGSFAIARKSIYLLPQVPIIASLFFGSVTGAASANVAATGSFTIPLMKKYGIPSATAGAIESVASTGGQIMPPVMGATAFLIAMMLGKDYLYIMLHGFIPAMLFYGTFAIAVYFATKKSIQPLVSNSHKETINWVEENRFTKDDMLSLIPAIISITVILVTLILFLMDPLRSALFGICALLATQLCYEYLKLRKTAAFMIFLKKFVNGARIGAVSAAQIGSLTAGMALIIKGLTVTALGPKISFVMVDIGHASMPLLLLLIWVICMIFGMAVSTLVVYLLVIVLTAPALKAIGLEPIVSHFVVFYFGSLAMITPPVAPACIVGAGIAGETFMKTALSAVRLGSPLFILPFAFAAYPELICLGSQTFSAIFVVGVGLISVSYSLNDPDNEWHNLIIRVGYFTVGAFILFCPLFFKSDRVIVMIISIVMLLVMGRTVISKKWITLKNMGNKVIQRRHAGC